MKLLYPQLKGFWLQLTIFRDSESTWPDLLVFAFVSLNEANFIFLFILEIDSSLLFRFLHKGIKSFLLPVFWILSRIDRLDEDAVYVGLQVHFVRPARSSAFGCPLVFLFFFRKMRDSFTQLPFPWNRDLNAQMELVLSQGLYTRYSFKILKLGR